jgi:hypothetical protein
MAGGEMPDRPKPDWKIVKKIDDGTFAVWVSALQTFVPRYSLQMGRLRPDGTLAPFIPLNVEGTYQITFRHSPAKAFIPLLEKAEEWILGEAAIRVDERVERETQAASGPKTRVTGKTARKKAKLQNRDQT